MKLNELPASERRVIRAWCMYDWANSAFATSGAAAIFPVYFVVIFTDAMGPEAYLFGMKFTGSSLWSLGAAISTAIVALSSPLLGVIADRVPIKKLFLWIYTIVGSLFTVLAFFSAYTAHPWAWMFGTFLLANIGFAGCLVFYNSLLTHVSPRHLLDDVSSRGFAYGYIGGGLLLMVHLALNIVAQQSDALDVDFVTRASIASIGFWWFGWGIWTMLIVPEPPIHNRVQGLKITNSIQMSFGVLMQTFREITKFKVLVIYLCAYLLFNDGIQTIMAIAGAFAADTLDIPLAFNMMTILIIQFVAAGGAMGFSWLSDRTETKTALVIALAGWSFIVFFGVALTPLEPNVHNKFGYQLAYESDSDLYIVRAIPEMRDSVLDDSWIEEIGSISEGQRLSYAETEELLGDVISSDHSRHSISIEGGVLDGHRVLGSRHPANLGSGQIDFWPIAVRSVVWAPLGIDVQYQWLILGVLVGLVMGGSQALARSLFAQMVPETRSGEFFSFFGFVGRASTVFGPMIYVIVTGMFDTRLAIASILALIIAGTLMLRWVDVKQGIKIASDEDDLRLSTGKQ